MSITTIVAIAAACLVGLTFTWRFVVAPRVKRHKEYVKQISVCGYVGPPPTDKAWRRHKFWARFLTWLQVGKLTVVGRENLDSVPGPILFASNHPYGMEVAITPLVLDRKARYMAHETVFTFAWGLGSYIAGPWGGFVAHDKIRDHGVRARTAATSVLKMGQTLVMYPEGLTNMSPVMLPLKDGAVRVVKQAAKEMAREAWIVPAYMRYGRYPSEWMQRFPRPVQYALVFLLLPWFRRGCKVVVGKPIPASAFAADDAEATLQLRAAIEVLDPKTVK
jgi:1-acyl-sn-glycerol-3-phosphate acyltransferase